MWQNEKLDRTVRSTVQYLLRTVVVLLLLLSYCSSRRRRRRLVRRLQVEWGKGGRRKILNEAKVDKWMNILSVLALASLEGNDKGMAIYPPLPTRPRPDQLDSRGSNIYLHWFHQRNLLMLSDVVVCSLSEERRSVLLDTFPTKVYVYNVSSTT